MKRQFLKLAVGFALLLQACGGAAPKEVKLEKMGLTITADVKDVPEYTNTKVSDTDTELANYDFNIGGDARVNVIEITESVFPTDIDMLKKALTADPDFISVTEEKKFSNGAFGVIYKEKGSTKEIMDYKFYFKKGNRYFRVIPVFNNDLTDLDKQEAAIESLK